MVKKVLFDCRMINSSGIGVYTRELLSQILKSDVLDVYVLINSGMVLPSSLIIHPSKILETSIERFSIKNFLFHRKILFGFDIYFIPFLSIPPICVGRLKIISTIHDLCPIAMRVFFGYKYSMLYWIVFLIQGLVSKKIIAISDFTKSEVNKYYKNIFNKKIIVIKNGIRIIDTDTDTDTDTDRFFLNQSNERVGICVGNVKPHKNIYPFISYLKSKKYTNYKLYIIGDYNNFLTGYSSELFKNLPENIIFTGPISDTELHRFFQLADFIILPSLYEGFGLPLLEAMQYNISIFAADIPVFHEIAGDTVLYFDPVTFDGLMGYINSVHNAKKANYSKVIRSFSWEKSCDKLIEVFYEKNNDR